MEYFRIKINDDNNLERDKKNFKHYFIIIFFFKMNRENGKKKKNKSVNFILFILFKLG